MTKSGLILSVTALFAFRALSCDLNPAQPLQVNLTGANDEDLPRQVVLRNNIQLQLPDAPGVLQMQRADGLALLDDLRDWPTDNGQISSIKAQPVAFDLDLNGAADAVYLVDSVGLVWVVPLTASGFGQPELIADFSQTGAEFTQPLQLVQSVALDGAGRMLRQTMLIIIGSQPDGDILLAVKHRPQQNRPQRLEDLADRTDIDADEQQYGIAEQLWQQIQRGAGWYMQLQQRVTASPQVYAGVVYLTSADVAAVQPDCSLADDAVAQLHAIHLHHAGVVYARRKWQIEATDPGQLQLTRNEQNQFELSLDSAEQKQRLLTDVLTITTECADCVAQLDARQFPQLTRLATFQREQGAH